MKNTEIKFFKTVRRIRKHLRVKFKNQDGSLLKCTNKDEHENRRKENSCKSGAKMFAVVLVLIREMEFIEYASKGQIKNSPHSSQYFNNILAIFKGHNMLANL